VKDEIQQAMQGITALYERWRELLNNTNTSQNDEFKWTTNELKTGLKTVDLDLHDLEETVNVAESNKARFKIDDSEIMTRKGFILSTKQKIRSIEDEMNGTRTRGKMERDQRELLTSQQRKPQDKYDKLKTALEQENEDYIGDHKQKQEQIIRDQDQNLEVLHKTVGTLQQIGKEIDGAIKEHDVIINDLHTDVDRVDSGIKGAIKSVNKLLDSMKDSTQWCIIIFLIVVLIGLIILVFYV